MTARFEELDWRPTPMGAISLRRRQDPVSGDDVYEVKLDDDFLTSSLFIVAEVEVARLALAELSGPGLDTTPSVAPEPGGIFSLWSNDPPEEDYEALLAGVFVEVKTQVVTFHNQLQERESANTV